ncbi:MAG: hypothetical protein GY847_17035, partial [Proteobacteria bacterium]|nr:hypothetical protein [Pseudomonadota bacterium]
MAELNKANPICRKPSELVETLVMNARLKPPRFGLLSVASRAHRALGRLERYAPWGTKATHTSIVDQLELQKGEELIGVYHNHDDSTRDAFVVT